MEEEEECCGNLEGKRGRRREKVRNWEERGLGDDGRSLGAQLGGRRRRWEKEVAQREGGCLSPPHPLIPAPEPVTEVTQCPKGPEGTGHMGP